MATGRRRRHRPEWDEHLSGVAATFDGDCAACGDNITVRVHRVVKDNRGRWIHIHCANGYDDA